jgi:tetratricopeptide (TPR) repeat protein
MVLTMNNNNYESMRAFLVTGLIVCSCAFSQVHAGDSSQLFASSTSLARIDHSLTDIENTNTTAADEAQYGLLLEQIESEFGPFDARLSEPLLSVGDMLANQGAYLEALISFERALHVMRINQGLYSEPLIAVVERLIDCNVGLEDWKAVDENFRYLEFLYGRLFEKGSEQWALGIAQVSDWHIIALNNSLGSNRDEHLREANKLFKLRLNYAEQDGNADPEAIEVMRHNIEYTAYHLRQRKDDEIRTERAYTRLDSRYRERDNVASLD